MEQNTNFFGRKLVGLSSGSIFYLLKESTYVVSGCFTRMAGRVQNKFSSIVAGNLGLHIKILFT